ncbi:hypothetical protein L9W92_02055 [Pelotomaculum terephthalicicum JT]|uniref:hypothetical protein n=1 Tax=Pelotomaculum TaxID=191373 RepID=UPI0009CE9673|nr:MULTISPECIES: hypothetical protein [Pelotomaculum]MCG9966843.1 hypothetical protein [Pelotomaculum terephthalicicum JT]OPX89595.1 MAG: hypothetical protein A4E54_00894 [Pelotomaculum sp. PtaB.Bin117]OPY60105.1 MAG: hypothetical protein A4E56_02907 [Pelotomaculum sp. PtaU1.Bin065]
MRTVLKYKAVGFNKTKTIFLTALLLLISFISGAMLERSDNFLQDIYAIAPVVLDEVKTFFREQVFIKVNSTVGCLKWGSVITLSIFERSLAGLIRGP